MATRKVAFHVSPAGSDRNPGTRRQPLKTLARARRAVRESNSGGAGGITVWLHEGTYHLATSFRLTKADSGRAGAPVVYRARKGEEVRLTGAREIPANAFVRVSDAAVLKRIDRSARSKVLQADLKALGLTDFGDATALGKRPDLFFNDEPMTLARWPNEGFTAVGKVMGGKPTVSHGIKGDLVGKFTYAGKRPSRWAEEKDARLYGYWFWDWASAWEKVASINTTQRTISTAAPYHHYGYRQGQRFYALNLLSELDTPGEWYLDRDTGILYFWPPDRLDSSTVAFSVLEMPLVDVKNASHVVLRDLTLERTRGMAVRVSGGTGVVVAGCTIRNTGTNAVAVSGGSSHTVTGCDIYNTGTYGISISGGDRRTLTPARHCAVNNHIHHFARLQRTYAAAISLSGVGNRAAHNYIHDAPHWAVSFAGNDHVMELNELHDLCYETGDVGVFYTGRDWTVRGNVIRHNFVHHISGPGLWGAQVIYLDDAASGTEVRGNIIYKGQRAMLIGGGRDNVIVNNIIVACDPPIHIDNRGLNWMAYHVNAGGIMPEKLAEVPYRGPIWSKRYPKLVNILDDDPGTPKGNVVRHNVIQRCTPMNIAAEALRFGTVADNLVTNAPVGFVDPRRMDFRLKAGSIVWKALKGFRPIPLEKIGLRKDTYRRTLPRRR